MYSAMFVNHPNMVIIKLKSSYEMNNQIRNCKADLPNKERKRRHFFHYFLNKKYFISGTNENLPSARVCELFSLLAADTS